LNLLHTKYALAGRIISAVLAAGMVFSALPMAALAEDAAPAAETVMVETTPETAAAPAEAPTTPPSAAPTSIEAAAALFAALPAADSVSAETTEEEKETLNAQLDEAMAAYDALSEADAAAFEAQYSDLLAAALALNDALTGNVAVTLGTAGGTVNIEKNATSALSLLNDYKTDASTPDSLWNAATKTLTLNGVDFETTKPVAMILPANSIVVLNGTNSFKSSTVQGENIYAIQCVGAVTIRDGSDAGTGVLKATAGAAVGASTSSGIYSKDGALTLESGEIETSSAGGVRGESYGIYAKGLSVSGGKLSAAGGSVTEPGAKSYGIYPTAPSSFQDCTLTATAGTVGTNGTSYGIYNQNYNIKLQKTTATVFGQTQAFATNQSTNLEIKGAITAGDDEGTAVPVVSYQKEKWVNIVPTADPVITVGAQAGTLTYGTAGSATYAVTGSHFTAPAFAPVLDWYGTAHAGIDAAFSADNKTLTLTTTAAANAGTYTFKVRSGDVVSDSVNLVIGKADATSEMKTVAVNVPATGKTNATITLADPPTGGVYDAANFVCDSGTIAMVSVPTMEGNTITYSTNASAEGATATITVPVINAKNYEDYAVVITITAKNENRTLYYNTADGKMYSAASLAADKEVTDVEGWSHGATNNILNLTGINYTTTAGVALEIVGDCTIQVTGENSLACETTGLNCYVLETYYPLTIRGTSRDADTFSLTAANVTGAPGKNSNSIALYADKALTLENVALKANAGSVTNAGARAYSTGICAYGAWTATNSDITAWARKATAAVSSYSQGIYAGGGNNVVTDCTVFAAADGAAKNKGISAWYNNAATLRFINSTVVALAGDVVTPNDVEDYTSGLYVGNLSVEGSSSVTATAGACGDGENDYSIGMECNKLSMNAGTLKIAGGNIGMCVYGTGSSVTGGILTANATSADGMAIWYGDDGDFTVDENMGIHAAMNDITPYFYPATIDPDLHCIVWQPEGESVPAVYARIAPAKDLVIPVKTEQTATEAATIRNTDFGAHAGTILEIKEINTTYRDVLFAAEPSVSEGKIGYTPKANIAATDMGKNVIYYVQFDANGDGEADYSAQAAFVALSKQEVDITGLTAADGAYNGQLQPGYTGTPVCKVGETDVTAGCGTLVTTYTGTTRGGSTYSSSTAPTDAGDYTVTLSVAEDNANFSGSISQDFHISPKIVAVAADDKIITQGSALPELTVSYTGFVGRDTAASMLGLKAVLATAADRTVAGSYPITFTTLPLLNEGGTNYDLGIVQNGTLTVVAPSYKIIEGANQNVNLDGNTDARFRSDAPFSEYVETRVDNAVVGTVDLIVSEGSTIVTLKSDYVRTLSTGSHTLSIVSRYGHADTSFTVSKSAPASTSALTIKAWVTAGGTISPIGSSTVRQGDSITYTITPSAGYLIKDVKVDGVSVGAVSSYTFSNITRGHEIGVYFDRGTAAASRAVPKTADAFHPVLWAVVMLGAALSFGALWWKKRKQSK
jgi:hypothetical protein